MILSHTSLSQSRQRWHPKPGHPPIVFWNAGGLVFYSDLIDNAEDLVILTTFAALRTAAARMLLQRAALTVIPALAKITGVLIPAGASASNSRLGTQFATAGLLASIGFGL